MFYGLGPTHHGPAPPLQSYGHWLQHGTAFQKSPQARSEHRAAVSRVFLITLSLTLHTILLEDAHRDTWFNLTSYLR